MRATTFSTTKCTSAIQALYAPGAMALAISLAFMHPVYAARLGELQVKSALGETFLAHIPVMMSKGERLGAGCVGIAPSQSSEINASVINDLNIRLIDGAGSQKILVVSSDSRIREPSLRLAVRVGCDSSITREYIAFLDPPVVADNSWAAQIQNYEEPLRFSLNADRPLKSAAATAQKPKETLKSESKTATKSRASKESRGGKDDSDKKVAARGQTRHASPAAGVETFKLAGSLAPASLDKAQRMANAPVVVADNGWLKTQEELQATVSQLAGDKKRLEQERAVLTSKLRNEQSEFEELKNSSVSTTTLSVGIVGMGLLGLLLGVFGSRVKGRVRSSASESSGQEALTGWLDTVKTKMKKPRMAEKSVDAYRQSTEASVSINQFEPFLTQSPEVSHIQEAVDEPAQSIAEIEPVVSSFTAVNTHVTHSDDSQTEDLGMTFTLTDSPVDAWGAGEGAQSGFELEEVHSSTITSAGSSAGELDVVQGGYDQSLGLSDFPMASERGEGGFDADLDQDVQNTLHWLEQGVQTAVNLSDGEHSVSPRSMDSVAYVAPWFIALFDTESGRDQLAECVKQIKTYFVTHDDTPFALWSLWMNWLEQQGHQSMLKALTPRFEQRFGVAYPGGQLATDREPLPEMIVDMVDMYIDQTTNSEHRQRLLMNWLDSRHAPSYVLNRPDLFVELLKRIEPSAQEPAYDGFEMVVSADQVLQG